MSFLMRLAVAVAPIVEALASAFWRSYFKELRRSRQVIYEEPSDEDKDRSDRLAERLREQLREERHPRPGSDDVPRDFSPHNCPHRDSCAVWGVVRDRVPD